MTPRLIETPVDPIKEPQLFRQKPECVEGGKVPPTPGGVGGATRLTCSVLLGDQRTPEWFEARRGVVTASRVGKHVLAATKAAREATSKLVDEVLADALTPEQTATADKPEFSTYWMSRGVRLEPFAREEYERITENQVEEVAFCLHESGAFGCSPDGLVNDRSGGLEIKCPEPRIHIAYLRAGVVPDQYVMQLEASMAVTGLPWWDFISFCPGLSPLILRTERSETTEQTLRALLDLGVVIATENQRLRDMWDATFKS